MRDTGSFNAAVIISMTSKHLILFTELACVDGAICAFMLMCKAFPSGRMLPLKCFLKKVCKMKKEKPMLCSQLPQWVIAKMLFSFAHIIPTMGQKPRWNNFEERRECRKCLSEEVLLSLFTFFYCLLVNCFLLQCSTGDVFPFYSKESVVSNFLMSQLNCWQ